MAPVQATSVQDFLHDLLPASSIRSKARELGVITRQRKADILAIVAVILLTLPKRGAVSRAYQRRTRKQLSRAAFYNRINKTLGKLIRWILDTLIQRARDNKLVYTGLLDGFKEVVAADASTIALKADLRDRWPGTNEGTAAIKIHTWIRALTGELLKYKITAATKNDAKAFGVTWKAYGTLFLLDRAYNSASLWWCIHRVGGFFVTRPPASYKPTIQENFRSHRGRARPVSGRKLREVLGEIERRVLDVGCLFRVRRHKYRSKNGKWHRESFRVVAVRNAQTGAYHQYVTNLPADRWPVENIGELHRLRWEVELSYKVGKSGCGLSELCSKDADVVELLARSALIRATVSMQARLKAQAQLPKNRWINPVMWVQVWNEELTDFIAVVAQVPRTGVRVSFRALARLAVCPDRKRAPLRYLVLQTPPKTADI